MDKYSFKQYDYRERWISYWHQINEVICCQPATILEIGPGNKTVSDYLKKLGLPIKTMDISVTAGADEVGSVLKMPFADKSFDVILCAEVLEHLSFDNFPAALGEIGRVTKKKVILSLPHWGTFFYLKLKMPLLPLFRSFFKVSGFRKHRAGGEHFWEIGKTGYSTRKIKKIIEKSGFKIIKDFIDPESPYHHFFILEK